MLVLFSTQKMFSPFVYCLVQPLTRHLRKKNPHHDQLMLIVFCGLHDGLLKLCGPIIFKMKQPDSKLFPGIFS